MKLFIVFHTHELEDDYEDVKFIGVYSSQASAQKAVERLKVQPGFCETPNGFTIDAYLLDQDNWKEGYVTEKH